MDAKMITTVRENSAKRALSSGLADLTDKRAAEITGLDEATVRQIRQEAHHGNLVRRRENDLRRAIAGMKRARDSLTRLASALTRSLAEPG